MPRIRLYRRGPVYWCDFLVSGLRVRRSTGATSRPLATTRANDILEAALQESARLRAKDCEAGAERWRDEYLAMTRNSHGQRQGYRIVRDYVLPVIGRLQPVDVGRPQLVAIRKRAEAAGLSPRSVLHVLSEARCLLRFHRNPISIRTVRPRLQEIPPQRLTDAEVAAILADLTPNGAFVVRLLLATGLRWGEMHRLRWSDVAEAPAPHLVIANTKSGRFRVVPLGADLTRELVARRSISGSEFVAPIRAKNGCCLVTVTVRRRAARGAPPLRWHPHQLRHTFATRFIEAGGRPFVLKEILGHTTLRMTEHYARIAAQAVFAEFQRLQSGTAGDTVNGK
jgi:integrase/recombinase XerD